MSRHISGPVTDFKLLQDLNVRVRLASLFPQNFQYPSYRFADVVLEFIHGLPLRIATRQGWNLCPKSAFRVFVNDNSVVLHVLIFSHGQPTSRFGGSDELDPAPAVSRAAALTANELSSRDAR